LKNGHKIEFIFSVQNSKFTQYWLDGQVDVVTIAEKSVSAHATVQLQFLVKLSCSLIMPLKQT
jgi:hypothetical protein